MCYPHPVDARNVPPELHGFRTAFAGLHHLRPDDVIAVLRSAVAAGSGVAAFEFTQRSLGSLAAMMMLTPAAVWLLTPRSARSVGNG